MNREQWIQKLKKMGLSGYEAQVYLALLGETRAPASRVVRKSGVPQSKVYGALNSLIERGFAEQVLGDVKLYRGLPPQQAFENYRRQVEASLAESQSAMTELADTAPDAPSDDPGSLGIRLVRARQISSVFEEAQEGSQSEFLVAVKAPLVIAPDTATDQRMLKRGVNLRYLIETRLLRDPVHGAALVRNAEETGVIRFVDHVPLRFVVIDRATAMIELAESDGSTMGLVVPNRGLAENMRLLFNSLWAHARTLDELPAEFREPVTS
ncbi:MAG: TrmB family transcriptional regulator [Planctomycetes bacterium]|nr:TrmB family transcriptional regulator [Planctomycetota bacterium]MCL4731303.1 helix-turn-helix domain-containing protein [Planctomycetota bacterium]